MNRKKIYLSGPILGCNKKEAREWRLNTIFELKNQYDFINPATKLYKKEADHFEEVVEFAEKGVEECDIILAYIPFYSMGTSIEICWAYEKNKKILVVLENDEVSAFLKKYSDKIFKNLEEAYQYLGSGYNEQYIKVN
jgi:nucleoside 2-deoxyribosyltransferase